MGARRTEWAERISRIEQMIDEYREAKRRRLVRRAIRLWRKTEARQQLIHLEAPPERVH